MIKQVIVVRKDLKMRRGKEIAQGGHATNAILIEVAFYGKTPSKELMEWLNTGTTKITLPVDTQEELWDIYQKALDAGLYAHIVKDSGKTEFNGVPTYTCVSIGPDHDYKIDLITGHLRPY